MTKVEVWAVGDDQTGCVVAETPVGDDFAVRVLDPTGEVWFKRDVEGHWHIHEPVPL